MAEAALPWASTAVDEGSVQPGEEQPAGAQAATPSFLTLEAAGVSVGGRVEVKWQIETDDGEPYSRWWGATVIGPSDQQDSERPGAPVYELAYDAHGEFEQERSHVIFVAEHTLRQLDQTEELSWRREGEEWDDEEEDDGDEEAGEGGEATDGEVVVTMDDLREMVKDEKKLLGGKTLEEAEGEVLGAMEPSKRIAIAAGYRDFADNLMSFLHEKVAANEAGGPVTVTEEHVRAFMESMNKKQRTR